MNKFYLYCCLFFLSHHVYSQTNISGIINDYAKVTAVESCSAQLTVTNASNFAPDDFILIIQMQGAIIEENDNSNFGSITDFGGAGLYEKAEIGSIAGNTITLKKAMVNSYEVSGNVQIVSFPKYLNATVNAPITGMTWDGSVGGVVALEVENTLTLEADISVTGLGFRGGNLNIVNSDCGFFTNANDYYYSSTNWRGAAKGEGIALPISGKEHGRGAQANGGGGGNDHNTGGGGGAHVADGGQGGKQNPSGTFGCSGEHPGRGGKGVGLNPDRIFLGGGGGSGHADNNNVGSAGGNGGGIIIVLAPNIVAAGNKLVSNGLTPNLAGGDGAGGGGAGGTILLLTDNIMGTASVESNGGDGGDTSNPSDRCFGPGGGGSAGRVLSDLGTISGFTSIFGGEAGINSTNAPQCNGLSNEATDGQFGSLATLNEIPEGTIDNEATEIISEPESATLCEGDSYTISTEVTGVNLSFQWRINDGSGFVDVQNNGTFSGANTANLLIQNAPLSLNGNEFFLEISDGCSSLLLSNPITIEVAPAASANFIFTNQGSGLVQFDNLSANFTGIFWDFGDTNTSSGANPTHQYDSAGVYTVILTAFGVCDTAVVSQEIEISSTPVAAFSVLPYDECAPVSIQFTNESSESAETYLWMFEGGLPALSSMENPSVTYNSGGTFEVSLIVSNDEGSDTLVQENFITVQEIPNVNFDFSIGGLSVDFSSDIPNFSGALSWDFGDNSPTTNEENPSHLYANAGTYLVTLTASNNCGEVSLEQEISVGSLPIAAFSSQANSDCVPITVSFADQSSGQDITEWFWEFPGGNPATSTEQNPAVIYSIPGVYDVSLTITSGLGQNTFTSNNHVTANTFPDAEFDFSITDFTVDFINNSSGGMTYTWNFGDGSPPSNETDPTHTYTSGGIYDVTLTASNISCSTVKAQSLFIDYVSTEEVLEEKIFSVFPNPVSDILQVEFFDNFGKKATIRLIDLQGKVLQEQIIYKNEKIELEAKYLASGVYLLEVATADFYGVKKILKK